MARIESIHLFGVDDVTGSWQRSPVRATYRHREPTWDELAKALSGPRPVALAVADRIASERLTSADVDAGVTIFADSASAATDGRGSSDLIVELLRTAPLVGISLIPRVLELGAVAFGGEVSRADPVENGHSIETLEEAVATRLGRTGGNCPVLAGVEPDVAFATNPPELRPRESSDPRISNRIGRFDPVQSLGRVASAPDASAVKAGLWLWFDFLDESHRVSQSIEGEGKTGCGDCWHAIMHRREGDYGNAKYWFRRASRSPVFRLFAERAPRVLSDGGEVDESLIARLVRGGTWDPAAFVDACAEAERTHDLRLDFQLRRLQADEMLLLLLQSIRDARG